MAKHPFNERPLINRTLKKIREELGLTQEQAAALMGMKYDTYAKKECSGNITFQWAEKWAKSLGADFQKLAVVFKTLEDEEKKQESKPLDFTPVKGLTLTAKSPTTGIDNIYGPAKPQVDTTKKKEKYQLPFEPDITEISCFETFHTFTKPQKKEVMDLMNEIKERGR